MSTIPATAVSVRKPLYQSLFVQVLVALLLGIALGMALPDFAIDRAKASRVLDGDELVDVTAG